MLDSIYNYTSQTNEVTLGAYIICTVASLVLGLVIAVIHMYRNTYNKNFVITLVIMPAVVQAVIMLVNGNLGTGLAVMGAFSLIRFRSIPGNAREIGNVFLAMAAGLATGMGYIGIGFVFVLMIGLASIILNRIPFAEGRHQDKHLKVVIPEDLNYEGIFDDIFEEYTTNWKFVKVKTVNMGSLFELHYQISMKSGKSEKEMIDAIRCRNGNLNIVCGYVTEGSEIL